MEHIIIGVDPHKLSATTEVVDQREQMHGSARLGTDRAGCAAMGTYAKTWPDRLWAVEGANGVGRPPAQRLLEAGERVVDVPAKLAARFRLFDTGHNMKNDARGAHSIAIVAVRTMTLRVLKVDGELEALRMLTDRREALTRRPVQIVDRLQALLAGLLPGQAKRDISAVSHANPVAIESRCHEPAVLTTLGAWLNPAADRPNAASMPIPLPAEYVAHPDRPVRANR